MGPVGQRFLQVGTLGLTALVPSTASIVWMSVEYPEHRIVDVVLRDGSTVRIRPARREDAEMVEDFFIDLSPESRQLRFWTSSIDIKEVAAKATDLDYSDHLTLLALSGPDKVIGGAQYQRTDATRAEVSVSIADELQGQGLGSILIAQLAQAAHENGIPTFTADVLPENHKMIHVFRDSGFSPSIRALPGSIEIEFATSVTEETMGHIEARESRAAISAMNSFLSPATVAVVGASRDRRTIGGRLFHNLVEAGFSGSLFPVNPKASSVQGIPSFGSVMDVPVDLDLVFIVVPASVVNGVARECATKGVQSLVVISSGFGEIGSEGKLLQDELVAICRDNGMRLIGPNCMGIINTASDVSLNGTFGSAWPPSGRVGFMSQSGALGLAVMEYSTTLNLGLSSFVSVGNKADISGNDLLCYWEEDANTDVILLYLESVGNPRKFARVTRRLASKKPIVVVKSGRSKAGKRAAASHTGSLVAASEVTVDALFRQSGVIRTDTLEEMFGVATLLANQPTPKGDRVAIITNAGGLGIMCTDSCEANGLQVLPLSEDTIATLDSFLPEEASSANPVDMIASAAPADYARTIELVAKDPNVDALIIIYIPPDPSRASEIATCIKQGIQAVEGRVPILTTFMSAQGLPQELQGDDLKVPSYRFPEQAAIALAQAAHYGKWLLRSVGVEPGFPEIRQDEAAAIIAAALDGGGAWLSPEHLEQLLACYGLPMAHIRQAATPEEAGALADETRGPVALKAVGPSILHKTEVGAVQLNLSGSAAVTAAARRMKSAIEAGGMELEGFAIQPMVPAGVEMLVGVFHDRLFGPVVACGAGGTAVELVKDVSVRITPLTDLDASEMVRSLATFPLLDGYRGSPRADIGALEDMLLRVSTMVDNHPEIAELDCNPVMVLERGAVIVDARLRVEEAPPTHPVGALATA